MFSPGLAGRLAAYGWTLFVDPYAYLQDPDEAELLHELDVQLDS